MSRDPSILQQARCLQILFYFTAAVTTLAVPVAVQAQPAVPAPTGWETSVLLKAGTLGAGPELDVRLPHSSFGVRADIDGLAFSRDDLISSHFAHAEPAYAYDSTVRFGGTVKLLNGGITADYYPFGTGLRLSAGVIGNGNEVTMHGVPVGQLRIGTTTYSGVAPGRVDASATFNAVAPTIGLGYSALLFGRLRVSVDVGAMYQGNPHLSYQMTGAFTQLPAVAADAERERRRLQHQADYPVYPIAMLGLGWQF